MIGKTFIEKMDYYYSNRVFVVLKLDKKFITTKVINLDTWKFNVSKISIKVFREKMELSPIQMNPNE